MDRLLKLCPQDTLPENTVPCPEMQRHDQPQAAPSQPLHACLPESPRRAGNLPERHPHPAGDEPRRSQIPSHAATSANEIFESVPSVRICSTTLVRLLHGLNLLPSGISGKMTISLYTTTIIAMLVVSFLPVCLATNHLFVKPRKLP